MAGRVQAGEVQWLRSSACVSSDALTVLTFERLCQVCMGTFQVRHGSVEVPLSPSAARLRLWCCSWYMPLTALVRLLRHASSPATLRHPCCRRRPWLSVPELVLKILQ